MCDFTSGDSFGELSRDGDVGVNGRRGVLSDGCIDVQKVGLFGLVKGQRQGSLLACVFDGRERMFIAENTRKGHACLHAVEQRRGWGGFSYQRRGGELRLGWL